MSKISRTHAAVLNTTSASVAQFVQLVVQFVSRTIFIHTLGIQLIGLNGLFVNILSYLNFAELGIGSAITFSLYKPLAKANWEQVSGIMRLFKRLYELIAFVVLVAGVCTTPFIPYLIKGNGSGLGVNLYIAFLLALLNTVMSYLVTYKRTLLIADQRGYLNTLNAVGFNIGGQILQIVGLLVWKSFYLYLIIQAVAMLVSNLRVSHVVDKLYKNLNIHGKSKIDKSIVDVLKRNVGGMVSAKLGGIVVNGTDNILLSMFTGLTAVGLYSNYSMITSGLTQVFNQLVSAVASSIGNLSATTVQRAKVKRVFYQYFTISSGISLVVSTGFAGFATIFVSMWLGKNAIYPVVPLFVISVNFYLQNLRQSLITYTSSYGLFWYARWKPIFEAIVNFGFSFWLVRTTDLGVTAVLLGTIISNLSVNVLWESYIVVKYAINEQLLRFLKVYLSFILLGTMVIGATILVAESTESLFLTIAYLVAFEIVSVVVILLIDLICNPKRYSLILNFIKR